MGVERVKVATLHIFENDSEINYNSGYALVCTSGHTLHYNRHQSRQVDVKVLWRLLHLTFMRGQMRTSM